MASAGLGLGRGLDALIRETASGKKEEGRDVVLVNLITPNPDQPRKFFSEKALDELASSIKAQGLLQPILVKPAKGLGDAQYEIVAGERRWRACQLAGLKEVPIVIKNFSAQETLVAALVENLQREDLNPVEEAVSIQVLRDEFALSQEDLSQKLGKSRSAIANSLRLLSLPQDIQDEVIAGRISAGHARALLAIEDSHAQRELKERIIKEKLAVREVEALVSLWKNTGSFAIDLQDSSSNDTTMPEVVSERADCETRAEEANSSINSDPLVRKSNKKPQSVKLLEAQTRISSVLELPVKVTGTEKSGKISISFTSNEELESLLQKLSSNEDSL